MKAVFLDRDGVLNQVVLREGKPYPPSNSAELELIPGAPEHLQKLRAHGFQLIVVTNQPDVRRGTQTKAEVETIHALLHQELPLDAFYVCYHDDQDACPCRKPKPGLLLQAAAQRGIALPGSFLIGDRWRDIEAGQAAGVRTVWIDYGYRERGPSTPPDTRVISLGDAVDWVIRQTPVP